jgi:hypothetical protein
MSRGELLAEAWAHGRVWQAVRDLSSGSVGEKRRGGGMRTTAARRAS